MGNLLENEKSIYDLTEENLNATEMDVLRMSGLPESKFEIRDVKVGTFEDRDVLMHTVICDRDPSKPTLVIFHGYNGSGTLLYRVINELSKKFTLILPDHIGMGSSSRPDNFDKHNMSAQQTIDYFLDYIENWRVAMDITDFYLGGHSLGGYIVGNYALKYP